MTLTEQYRKNAEDALAQARVAKDLETRRAWLNIADEWTALAAARLAIKELELKTE